MNKRQITIYYHGDEVLSGLAEDEFNMQFDEPLGPLMMTDRESQRHVANPYPEAKIQATRKAVSGDE